MGGWTWTLLIGAALIITLGVVFRKQLVRVPLGYAAMFLLGVLAAVGFDWAARKAEDVKRNIPL